MNPMRPLRASVALFLLGFTVAAAEQPAPLHYRIRAAGSDLGWELPATLHTVHGKAPEVSGAVDAEPAANGEWRIHVRVAVAAGAMTTGNSSRDKKMREKVLETVRFPEIVFESRQVTADLSRLRTGEHFTVEVIGDLSVHGKAASVQLPVDVYVFDDHVVAQGSFPLSWKQYGLADPSFGLITVKEPMKVLFRLEAAPESVGSKQ
jgi:polyisoprenoid-binding protein YceI